MTTQTDTANAPDIPPGEFLGHPRALWQLSNIEMWERFAYYGMRALLAVYVATTFFGHLGDQANAEASLVYGGYTALVYATGIIGGYILLSAFRPSHRPVATMMGFVSMVSFLILFGFSDSQNENLSLIMTIDIIAIGLLLIASVLESQQQSKIQS